MPTSGAALFDKMVAAAYARGKALSTATYFEIDDVIDPADSRRWVATALLDAPPRPRNPHKKRPKSIRGEKKRRPLILLPRHTGEDRGGGKPQR